MAIGTIEFVNVEFERGVIGTFKCFDAMHDGYCELIDELMAVTVNGYRIDMPPWVRYTNVIGIDDKKVYEYALAECDELRMEVMSIPWVHME